MHATPPNFLEQISNLSFAWITVIAAAITGIRVLMYRRSNTFAKAIGEVSDTVLLAVVLLFLLMKPFAAQAFFIPSASMEPTLVGNDNVGDKILVNKFVYRVSKPKTGDVVVFIPPKDVGASVPTATPGEPVNFIKRLVGQSGDTLQTVAGHFMVDGDMKSRDSIRRSLYDAGLFPHDVPPDELDQKLSSYHHVRYAENGVYADGKFISKADLIDRLGLPANSQITLVPGFTVRNEKRLNEPFVAEDPDYDFKIVNGQSLRREEAGTNASFQYDGVDITATKWDELNGLPAEPVPAGTLFMMGDNRNASEDSTFWGPLPRQRVVGKAQYIFWPLNRARPIVSQH